MEKRLFRITAEEKKLEKEVLAEYSRGNVENHIEYLVTLTRRAGTEDELKAARYIRDRLEEYGVEAVIHEVDAYISQPGDGEFEVRSPVLRTIPCLPRTFIPPTPPDGIEAEIIPISGNGLEDDYQGVDVSGKIVLLVAPPYRSGRAETVSIAHQKGAVAQIQVTPGKTRAINLGQVRYTWGNPTPDTMDKISKIPVITIWNEDGKYLAELARKGPVVAKIKANAPRGYRKIRVPVGAIQGMKEPEKYVILGGHYCSWFRGVTDNAAANSMMLEIARILSKHRKVLRRGVRFAWWSGHEQGTYAGSTWYADHFWGDIRDHAIAYLVNDGLGRKGSSGYQPKNTEEVRTFHEMLTKELLGLDVKSTRVTKSGDQSFWGIGVPSITGEPPFSMDVEGVWYSHTAEDTEDKLDVELLAPFFKMNTVAILRFCNSLVLPFEFVTVADMFTKGLRDLQKDHASVLDLSPVLSQTEELRKNAEDLNKKIVKTLSAFEKNGRNPRMADKFRRINACLMQLSRILIPILAMKAGKYGQDPWGTKFRPIPSLQQVADVKAMDAQGELYKASATALLRERNKLSDALSLANFILGHTLDVLK
ncbi:MAG: M28 family peptidase [Thermodesulfobacteriota bacterium]